ncbi:ferritin-like domain-containing protein [Cantharellus anzutake]|uniref:ferritin-like domain-containing protein n=1 Tax=Cantharellus anzutake TaxID=1750568 RepID=UPI0019059B8E|nr:ferritin-like domain-containing protein [Cantharellus anzutake]KAF8322753.1 ferritin-like domain-containing protein [Cantharellus anzutake]
MLLKSVTLLALSAFASAMPVKRAAVTDSDIFQIALTLEHLENAFYTEGLKKYDAAAFRKAGFPDWVRERITQVAEHEATHVKSLEKKLGSAATQPCTYQFPDTDAKSFVTLAGALEWGGASAYLGAISHLTDPDDITVAGSILATEARQAAWINSAALKGFPWDGSFNTPLTADEVLGIVQGFFKTCPASNPKLIAAPFPSKLTVGKAVLGHNVAVTFTPPSGSTQQFYLALRSGLKTHVSPIVGGQAKLPAHLQGNVFATVVDNPNVTTDANTVAGTAVLTFPLPANAHNS